VNNKQPGFGMDLHPAQLDFSYTSFKKSIPLAYERLLLDFIQRDQRLFLESGEVEASWKYIDSVVNNLGKVKMDTYMPFSEGLEIK
jgi:glucose-6-phosphate 1-dehydrogenase